MLQEHPLAAELLSYFRRTLPHAEILPTPLPELSEIQLWLVNPDIMAARLSEEVIAAVFEEPAYWSFCWASGQALARRIMQQPDLVEGKTVLDFGAGSGIVAIAAAMAGAKRVVACDCDPGAILSIKANAHLNHIELELSNDFFSHLNQGERFDVLTAADVLYDWENKPLLPKFLQAAEQVLIADSRVRDFSEPGYHHLGCWESITFPDMGELEEFKRVNFYSNRIDLL